MSSARPCGRPSRPSPGWPSPWSWPTRPSRLVSTVICPPGTTRSSIGGSSTSRPSGWPESEHRICRTGPASVISTSTSAGLLAELHHAKGRTRRSHLDLVPRARGGRLFSAAADLFIWVTQCLQQPAVRSSATARAGPTPSAGCWPSTTGPGGAPRHCCPGTGFPWWAGPGSLPGAQRHGRAPRVPGEPDPGPHEPRGPARTRSSTGRHAPPHLMERPYLRPVYDVPEFRGPDGVAALRRVVGREPGHAGAGTRARPGPGAGRPGGGPGVLAHRALALLPDEGTGSKGAHHGPPREGEDDALRLAGHLAGLAWLAAPDDPACRRCAGLSSPGGPMPRRPPWPTACLVGGPGVRRGTVRAADLTPDAGRSWHPPNWDDVARGIAIPAQLLILVRCPLGVIAVNAVTTRSTRPEGQKSPPGRAPGPRARGSDRPPVGTGPGGPSAWPWPLPWSSEMQLPPHLRGQPRGDQAGPGHLQALLGDDDHRHHRGRGGFS